MCPEKVSHKADAYSFGIVMWEMWSLKAPFAEGRSHEERVLELMNKGNVIRPPLPGTGGIPNSPEPGPGWKELMERCWNDDPEQRPEMSEVADALRDIARAVKAAQSVVPKNSSVPDEQQAVVGGGSEPPLKKIEEQK